MNDVDTLEMNVGQGIIRGEREGKSTHMQKKFRIKIKIIKYGLRAKHRR
jgi:hypothetical protein